MKTFRAKSPIESSNIGIIRADRFMKLILGLSFLLLNTSIVFSNTYYVSTSGSNTGWMVQEGDSITADDFKILSTASLAINKGISLGSLFDVDYFGTQRPVGVAWNIGAYEFSNATGLYNLNMPDNDFKLNVYPNPCNNQNINIVYEINKAVEMTSMIYKT